MVSDDSATGTERTLMLTLSECVSVAQSSNEGGLR